VGAGLAMSYKKDCIYLDANATTPPDPKVVDAVSAAMKGANANPSSPHEMGKEARALCEKARAQVASLMGTSPKEVIFTSGATEALNIAEQGSLNRGDHAITTAVEHHAVLAPLEALRDDGVIDLTVLPVGSDGRVDPEAVRKALQPNTRLVVVQAANNERGSLQPIAAIGEVLRQDAPDRVLFLVDATQAIGFFDLSPEKNRIDLMAISGHKFHGPKGVGALYIREGVKLKPLTKGGSQEKGVRPGTVPVPLVAGLGVASELAHKHRGSRAKRVQHLQQMALKRLKPYGRPNGPASAAHRLPSNLSFTIHADITGKRLRELVPGVAFSSGSACSCHRSHVLKAIGMEEDEIDRTIRLGFSPALTDRELRRGLEQIERAIQKETTHHGQEEREE
jgi:cysteine desulfurase